MIYIYLICVNVLSVGYCNRGGNPPTLLDLKKMKRLQQSCAYKNLSVHDDASRLSCTKVVSYKVLCWCCCVYSCCLLHILAPCGSCVVPGIFLQVSSIRQAVHKSEAGKYRLRVDGGLSSLYVTRMATNHSALRHAFHLV